MKKKPQIKKFTASVLWFYHSQFATIDNVESWQPLDSPEAWLPIPDYKDESVQLRRPALLTYREKNFFPEGTIIPDEVNMGQNWKIKDWRLTFAGEQGLVDFMNANHQGDIVKLGFADPNYPDPKDDVIDHPPGFDGFFLLDNRFPALNMLGLQDKSASKKKISINAATYQMGIWSNGTSVS